MAGLLSQLAPVAAVGALAPLSVVMATALLMSTGGLVKAIAFTAAGALAYAVMGALVLVTTGTALGSPELRSALAGGLLALAGSALWWMAYTQLVRPPSSSGDSHPFFDKLEGMTIRSAAVLGVIVTVANVKQLGLYLVGVSEIVGADLSTAQSWAALAILLAVFQIGPLLVIVAYVVARPAATRILERLHAWLLRRLRAISIALGSVVGSWFLVLATEQLVAW